MKIENTNINPAALGKTESMYQVEKQNAASVENTASVSKKDKAVLSDEARLLSKARVALENTSEVDEAKVNDLKAKIEKGEYNVPFENLAEKMLSKLGLK